MPIKALCRESLNMITGRPTSFPVTINMLITNKCNFLCKMCSWKSPQQIYHADAEEPLSIDDIEKFISRIKDYQPLIHIGGGEPFIRKDILEIIDVIKRNNLKCIVTTNGFLVDEAVAERLLSLKVDALIFSLYGWGSLHDQITEVEGSFERITNNLKTILDRRRMNTRVFVSTIPLLENIDMLEELIGNLYILGVDKVKIEQVNFLTSGEYASSLKDKEIFDLAPSTLIRERHFTREFITDLMQAYKAIYRKYRGFISIKPYLGQLQLINWYTSVPSRNAKCFFITHSVFINYNGDIIPCQFFLNCVLGNIREDSLRTKWRSRRYKELRDVIKNTRPLICKKCCKN